MTIRYTVPVTVYTANYGISPTGDLGPSVPSLPVRISIDVPSPSNSVSSRLSDAAMRTRCC